MRLDSPAARTTAPIIFRPGRESPCSRLLTWTSSAAMLTAISSTVRDPMGSPMGVWTRSNSAAVAQPSPMNLWRTRATLLRLPIMPTYAARERMQARRASASSLCPRVTMTMKVSSPAGRSRRARPGVSTTSRSASGNLSGLAKSARSSITVTSKPSWPGQPGNSLSDMPGAGDQQAGEGRQRFEEIEPAVDRGPGGRP